MRGARYSRPASGRQSGGVAWVRFLSLSQGRIHAWRARTVPSCAGPAMTLASPEAAETAAAGGMFVTGWRDADASVLPALLHDATLRLPAHLLLAAHETSRWAR